MKLPFLIGALIGTPIGVLVALKLTLMTGLSWWLVFSSLYLGAALAAFVFIALYAVMSRVENQP